MNDESFNIENKFINYNFNKKEKKKAKKFIFIILIFLLLSIAIFLFYMNKLEKESNKKSNDNYEEYDPNYKIEESNQGATITSNVTEDITSNITSNITITSNAVTSNIFKPDSNKTINKSSNITNKEIVVDSIKLSATSLSIEKGKTQNLSVTITPSNATNKNITWSSSNTSVATISGGKITAIKAGNATITAKTSNGKTATCKVTVTDNYVAVTGGHWVISNPVTIYIGNSLCLKDKFSISPSNATDKSINWKIDNSSIASINTTTGTIKGLKVGNTIVRGTLSNGKEIALTVLVRNNPANYAINITRTSYGHAGATSYIYFINVTKNGTNTTNFRSVTYNGATFYSSEMGTSMNAKCSVDKSIKYGNIYDEYGYILQSVKVNYDF